MAQLRIVSAHGGVEIAEALRDHGFGVTEFAGFGRHGSVEVVSTVVQRTQIADVMRVVDRFDPQAFVTTAEPQILRGGIFADRARGAFQVGNLPLGRARNATGRTRTVKRESAA